MSENAPKDMKYWRERGGQIEWRLARLRAEVREMERDLEECDEQIRRIQVASENTAKGDGA